MVPFLHPLVCGPIAPVHPLPEELSDYRYRCGQPATSGCQRLPGGRGRGFEGCSRRHSREIEHEGGGKAVVVRAVKSSCQFGAERHLLKRLLGWNCCGDGESTAG